jgi:glycosyltransferase involved in cell wall biosynthesis
MDFPFIGDSLITNLLGAENIYQNNLSTIWNYAANDAGHPTLYPLIIALFWTVMGKSLWVTHLIQVVVGFFLCQTIYKIATQYISKTSAAFAVLIFTITPSYVAQLTNASPQLPLTLVAFLAFYFLIQKRKTAYTLVLSIMMLVHLQGAFLLLFFALQDVLFFVFDNGVKQIAVWLKKRFFIYATPFLVLAAWAIFHYQQFGWAITSPNYLRDVPTLKLIAYNFAIAFWRIIDFGYAIPLLAVFIFFIKNRKKLYKTDTLFSLLFSYSLLLLVLGGGICATFSYPPAHRYFLPTTIFLLILFASVLEQMPTPKKLIWSVLASIALVLGNFMYYPGKCIGDSNIAYLPIYELEQEIKEDFNDSITFYTYAPLSYPNTIRHLNSAKGIRLKGLYNRPFDSVAYILHSNMNCEFSFDGLQQLKGWHGTTYEKNGIYVNIYANPAFIVKKPKGWQLRQPSNIELWMGEIKKKFK